jgi:hypothetical protein
MKILTYKFLFLGILALSLLLGTSSQKAYATQGAFSMTGSMNYSRQDHTATLLSNGKVFIVGGSPYVAATEVYDSTSGTFTVGGNLLDPRNFGNTATLLPNGKVLIAGGVDFNLHTTSKAELYDPSTHTFSQTGSMVYARVNHTATLLNNGKVLITGGYTDGVSHGVLAAELYDPSTGTFSLTGNMIYSRGYHQATLLSDGRVLITGGQATVGSDPEPGTNVEFYDPTSGTFILAGHLTTQRVLATATLLQNGQVLLVGGNSSCCTALDTSELYNPNTETSTVSGDLGAGRFLHTATLLSNGNVLVAGGEDESNNYLNSAEVYNPSTAKFFQTGSMQVARADFTAALLTNGKVLVAGGGTNTAELYDPNAFVNSQPNVTSITITPNPVRINSMVTATTTFTDTDAGQSHTATANWGDGINTATSCFVTEPGSTSGSISCPLSTGYAAADVYPVTITVSDGTVQTTSPVTYAYVYNPTQASIFSAGSRYNNPSSASPSTSGTVRFGLSYKYKGGIATGGKAFTMDFNGANFHFNATSVSSLVISNGFATLRGSGALNGTSGYNFLVTGIDGGDIRIQIADSSNNVVYDTQPGANITVTPTTKVTGHVVVH